jgi:transcriptional regulator with XRE-family HTH domain
MIETSGSSVREWESGRSMPSPEMLLKMSDLFGCTTDYLLGRTQERVGIRIVSMHPGGRHVDAT